MMDHPNVTNANLVKAQLAVLLALQDLDNQIGQRRRSMQDLEERILAANQALEQQRQDSQGRKQDLEKLLKERREAERQVKERQEQISKLGGQLFEVKTNEAYNTLQSEIKQKKQENALAEERILEMMLSEDDMNAALHKTAAEIKLREGQAAGEQAQCRQEIARLEAEINVLQGQWQEQAKNVQPDYLDRYQKLRDAKGGLALAKIENDICTGCRLTIRPQAVIELKKGRSLLFCENCARILYVD